MTITNKAGLLAIISGFITPKNQNYIMMKVKKIPDNVCQTNGN
jgi:hypothetical protein